jgi:hypothetical protein
VEFCCQAGHSNGTSRNPPEAGELSYGGLYTSRVTLNVILYLVGAALQDRLTALCQRPQECCGKILF